MESTTSRSLIPSHYIGVSDTYFNLQDDSESHSSSSSLPLPTTPTTFTTPPVDSPSHTPIPSPPHTPVTAPPPSLPPLLEHSAANPRNNAGVPPREWWKTTSLPIPAPQFDQPSSSDEESDDPVADDSPDILDGELGGYNEVPAAFSTCYADPQSYKEAMKRSDVHQWQEAANVEMNNHFENGTWDYVELPPHNSQ